MAGKKYCNKVFGIIFCIMLLLCLTPAIVYAIGEDGGLVENLPPKDGDSQGLGFGDGSGYTNGDDNEKDEIIDTDVNNKDNTFDQNKEDDHLEDQEFKDGGKDKEQEKKLPYKAEVLTGKEEVYGVQVLIYYNSVIVFDDLLFTEDGYLHLDFKKYAEAGYKPYQYEIDGYLQYYKEGETEREFERWFIRDDTVMAIYYEAIDDKAAASGKATSVAQVFGDDSLSQDFAVVPLQVGDTVIIGTAGAGANIKIYGVRKLLPFCEDEFWTDSNGSWSYTLPLALEDGDIVTVYHESRFGVESSQVFKIQDKPAAELVVNEIIVGDSHLSGTGAPGAQIAAAYQVTVDSTLHKETAVLSNGIWRMENPETIAEGDKVTVTQTLGSQIQEVTVTILGKPEIPKEDDWEEKPFVFPVYFPFEKAAADENTVDVPAVRKASLRFVCVDVQDNVIYEKEERQTVGNSIIIAAPSFDGYTLTDEAAKEITIASGQNEIVFLYEADNSLSTDEDGNAVTPFETVELPDYYITKSESLELLLGFGNGAKAASPEFTVMMDYFNVAGGTLTRGEFVVFIAAYKGTPQASSSDFTDVPLDHWAAGYIGAAQKLGWIAGYGDGCFRPDQPISKGEAVIVLNRAFGVKDAAEEGINNLALDIDIGH